jgi:hypothetical protein
MGALVSLDQVEFAQAYSNVATGAMGAAVATDRGSSHADASHFDTWNCANAAACAALEAAGSFVPVTLHLHVSGSASLTPGGGFMELTYSYDTSSLLGSNALGRFDFDFFEDPGFGLNADVEGKATFEDYHTGAQHDIFVDIASGGPANSGIIAFTADATVNTFIGGCVTVNCDLTNGIFTDTQSLSAIIDHANDNSAQILSSLKTFQTSFVSDLPFVSVDGRTAAAAAAAPEPGSIVLVGAVLLGLGVRRRAVSLISWL